VVDFEDYCVLVSDTMQCGSKSLRLRGNILPFHLQSRRCHENSYIRLLRNDGNNVPVCRCHITKECNPHKLSI
jgi:hypothetical protein